MRGVRRHRRAEEDIMGEQEIVHALERQDFIDRVADPVQRSLSAALDQAPAVRDVLHGKWLGHPLHAAMTDVPVGAWTAGLVLDLLEVAGGRRDLRKGADVVHAVGLAGALGAAIAGLADWTRTRREAKRVGFLHGAANMVIAGLYGASLLARAKRRRREAIALSSTGWALLVASSWLGGEIAYHYGVGVRPEALEAQAGDRAREGEPAPEMRADWSPSI
jgi:uncharacterized membrane protein